MNKLTETQTKLLIAIRDGEIQRNSLHTTANHLNRKGLLNYSYEARKWYITAAGIEHLKGGAA